jgi:hypothetical protein
VRWIHTRERRELALCYGVEKLVANNFLNVMSEWEEIRCGLAEPSRHNPPRFLNVASRSIDELAYTSAPQSTFPAILGLNISVTINELHVRAHCAESDCKGLGRLAFRYEDRAGRPIR